MLLSFLNNALDEQPEAALQTTPPNLIFFFAGFPPPRSAARRRFLEELAPLPWSVVFFEAPHRLAAVDGDRRLTFAEADAAVERIAAHLVERSGVRAPKVAVFLPNCLEYFLLYWSVVRLGGAIVPLNTWLKKDSLEGICANVRPEILVVRSPADAAPLQAAAITPPSPPQIRTAPFRASSRPTSSATLTSWGVH